MHHYLIHLPSIGKQDLSLIYESPGYWWRWLLRLGNRALPFQSRL
ncbi:hypothetical protein OSCI_3240022 [Kamptonema sp. PCC 6506]|nr:hypothetical protein OSCI_3240022 [Kamptonema sp. PCC 6506]